MPVPPQARSAKPRSERPSGMEMGETERKWATESRKPPDAESGRRRQLHATSGSLQGAAAGISASCRNGTRDYESAKMTSRETFVGSFFTSG